MIISQPTTLNKQRIPYKSYSINSKTLWKMLIFDKNDNKSENVSNISTMELQKYIAFIVVIGSAIPHCFLRR